MRIEGFDVTYLSSYDGLPVKNHLPVELRERFKTENQGWKVVMCWWLVQLVWKCTLRL